MWSDVIWWDRGGWRGVVVWWGEVRWGEKREGKSEMSRGGREEEEEGGGGGGGGGVGGRVGGWGWGNGDEGKEKERGKREEKGSQIQIWLKPRSILKSNICLSLTSNLPLISFMICNGSGGGFMRLPWSSYYW